MKKFKCLVCGFTYDEAAGLPEKGIAPGTKWEDVPHAFVCPWCGAEKGMFEQVKEAGASEAAAADESVSAEKGTEVQELDDVRELSAGELSALFSNLAKGCEKQRLNEETDLFNQLADYYKGKVPASGGKSFGDLETMLKSDLSDGYPSSNNEAAAQADRGALRSLVWSEKVSRMLASLLARYAKDGDAMLENTKIYVCDICGFVYVGDTLPEVCPVCKVPNFKMTQVGRR